MSAYFGYGEVLESDFVSVDPFTSENPLANGLDYKLATFAKVNNASSTVTMRFDFLTSSAKYVDYIAIANHDCTNIKIEGSNNTSIFNEIADEAVTPGTSFVIGTPTSSFRYIQVILTKAGGFMQFSHLSFGQRLQARPIGDGFAPVMHKRYKTLNKTNRNGEFLGSVTRRIPQAVRFNQQGITETEMRDDWSPFLEHANRKPFFFVPQYETYKDEAMYCWSEDAQDAVYRGLCKMAVSFNVQGVS